MVENEERTTPGRTSGVFGAQTLPTPTAPSAKPPDSGGVQVTCRDHTLPDGRINTTPIPRWDMAPEHLVKKATLINIPDPCQSVPSVVLKCWEMKNAPIVPYVGCVWRADSSHAPQPPPPNRPTSRTPLPHKLCSTLTHGPFARRLSGAPGGSTEGSRWCSEPRRARTTGSHAS